jgi:hypothetical protein
LKGIARTRDIYQGRHVLLQGDTFRLPFAAHSWDVIFSQGLLEHFDDRTIADVLLEQTRVAKTVIFSVPNKYYRYRDLGDERLMSKDKWEEIVRGFHLVTSEEYCYQRRRPNAYLLRPLMYLCKLRPLMDGTEQI